VLSPGDGSCGLRDALAGLTYPGQAASAGSTSSRSG